MYANIERLGARMDELGLAAIIATTKENVHYLTGIASVALDMFPHTGQCYAVLTRDQLTKPHFICTRCEVDQFLDAQVDLGGAMAYGSFFRELPEGVRLSDREDRLYQVAVAGHAAETALQALTWTLSQLGADVGRIAVDEDGVPRDFFDLARESLPRAELTYGAETLRWTRKVKTQAEVELIAAAARVAEQGILAAIGIVEPGVTEVDLVREFERTLASAGARPSFTLIKFGRDAVAGQTRPSRVPLRRGDHIWFDVGGIHNGYWFDIARVASFGEPSPRLRAAYAAVLAGEEAGIAQARPGMTGKELFHLTVAAVQDAGLPHYRRHHVGHGIGVEVYDRVLITPANDDDLDEGCIVNIETPYYEFGFGAVHVEDPFVVRRGGNELLTTLNRQLLVLD